MLSCKPSSYPQSFCSLCGAPQRFCMATLWITTYSTYQCPWPGNIHILATPLNSTAWYMYSDWQLTYMYITHGLPWFIIDFNGLYICCLVQNVISSILRPLLLQNRKVTLVWWLKQQLMPIKEVWTGRKLPTTHLVGCLVPPYWPRSTAYQE